MLSEIRVQNFAIIDKIEVQLAPGFNVITGETGAGKSIIIDAVDLMLGGRADAASIRAGSEKAVVEGVFKLTPSLSAELKPLLEAEGIEGSSGPEGLELTFTRELRSNGRNVCRLNGSTVNLQFFRDIGQRLVGIHGQTEHLLLLQAREHLYLLDSFGGLENKRVEVGKLVNEITTIRKEIDSLVQDDAAIARRIDMLRYQIEEIRAVGAKPGEEEALREESARLSSAEQLASLTNETMRLMDGDDSGVPSSIEMITQISVALAKAAKLDKKLQDSAALAETVSVQIEEVARTVRHYVEGIEHNPSRLNEVEDRLDAINRLKRKYGGTVEAVLEYAEKAKKDLETISNSEARIADLRVSEETLLRKIGEKAANLTEARTAAAKRLSHDIEAELADLRMEGTRFEVDITQEHDEEGCYSGARRLKFDHTGEDRVEFMLAANRGEPLRPLIKVASGGETARIMLALKSVLSRADHTPTLIFDEIDQGIGGRVGTTVGQKLWKLSTDHQVLCVTHLAQLAGFGDSHFKVSKSYRNTRTVTTLTTLDGQPRIAEIAEMLGAETDSNRQSAQEILATARQIKEGKGVQPELL